MLADYCSLRSGRQSIDTIKLILSTVRSTSVVATKELSKFLYISLPESRRPDFLSFNIDEVALERMMVSKFPSINFHQVLNVFTEKLSQLRSIIYGCMQSVEVSMREMRVQCIFQLFLTDLFKACAPSMEVSAANRDSIELRVTDRDDQEVQWNGFTDLKCTNKDTTEIKTATATIEMKVPFNQDGLYKTEALQPKQQLLGCAMGLNEMTLIELGHAEHKLSYLTDLFAISFMYYIDKKAYVSKRVTDTKGYCLRLLLMCCGDLSVMEWAELLGVEGQPIIVEDINDTVHPPSNIGPSAYPSATARGPVTCSLNNCGGTVEKQVARGTFRCEEEEKRERDLAEYTHAMRWQAKLQGYKYLGFDDMSQHSSIMS